MRVLYFGSCSNDEGDAANLMLRSLLQTSGVELFRFDVGLHDKTPSKFVQRRGRVNQISDEVIDRLVRKTKPDVVICAGDGLTPSNAMHEVLSERGIRRVAMTFHDPDGYETLTGRSAAQFDLFYTNTSLSIPDYQAVGASAKLLPPAVDPSFFHPIQMRKRFDVLAIGSSEPERLSLVEAFRASGLRVRCLGDGWKHGILGRSSAGRSWVQRVREINSASIVIAFSGTAVGIRVFEAASCGACILTEDSVELCSLFSREMDLVTYRSEEEAVAAAFRLCRHPEVAERIGISARSRILMEHTWDRRWQVVLEDMRNLLPPECPVRAS